MNKLKMLLVFITLLTISYSGPTFATDSGGIQIIVQDINRLEQVQKESLSRGEVFEFFGALMDEIPESYKYINLNFLNIEKGSDIEDALKKFVYLDRVPNSKTDLNLSQKIDAYEYHILAKTILNLDITPNESQLSNIPITEKDLEYIRNAYYIVGEKDSRGEDIIIERPITSNLGFEGDLLEAVLETLMNSHYDASELDRQELMYSAIEGLVNGVGDPYTTFFPPLENQMFEENLLGEYEGIGAYVQMSAPGVVEITAPVPGSPAEASGLKGGDIITKIDDNIVTEDVTLDVATSWIKGTPGTKVKLTINRNGQILTFDVTREKIIIKNIEVIEYLPSTYYIKINTFHSGVTAEFKDALNEIKSKNVSKIVIDLRNNGGGYLHEVNAMLSALIPEGDKISVIKGIESEESYISEGPQVIDLNDYEVVILQNSGTASASEIMIGTLLDYYDNITTIGETTYGKGSVQIKIAYIDGSSLKYTNARWFTGGTQTGIDGIGINPKVELELDIDKYNEGTDNQLEEALKY